ncbi:MAG: hypothetical protein ACYDD0_03260 [Candidatus Dormibacteria bacterium]
MCLWPYQNAGLGRPNPIPVPSLCVFGGMAAVVGQTAAQHLFLISCIGGAGFSMLWLLRRLGNPLPLCVLGSVLYQLSPAVVNQFQAGGPGILLAAAVFPAVLAGTVAPSEASPIAEGARAAALLAVATLFNPQAPVLILVVLAPFLVAAIARSGWRWTRGFCVSFGVTSAICSLPLLLSLAGESAAVAATGSSLAQQLILSVRETSVTQFLAPYAYVGVVPAVLGAAWTLRRKGSEPGELAAVASAGCIVGLWSVLSIAPLPLLHLWPEIALFKDFIKLQILLGISIAVMTVVGVRALVHIDGPGRRRFRSAAALAAITMAAGALVATEGPALASGDLGLGPHEIPRVYGRALGAMRQLAGEGSSYRVLWLPQDLRTVGTLSTLAPSSLMYRSDAGRLARQMVLQTYGAFTGGEVGNIASLLGAESVRFVVVQTGYRPQRDAPFETAPPSIAQIGGTRVLAGAPDYFMSVLDQAPGMVRISGGDGYVLYENRLWRPLLTEYRAMVVVDTPNGRAVAHAGPSLELRWKGGANVQWSRLGGNSVSIQAAPFRSWSPVVADVPVRAGGTYEVSGTVQATDARATHVKVIWLGSAPSLDASYVAVLTSDTTSKSFSVDLAAPPGAQTAQVTLMGGWSTGAHGFSRFGDIRVRAVSVPPSLGAIATRPVVGNLLQRQLPDLLIEAGARPSARPLLPGVDLITLQTAPCIAQSTHCAQLLSAGDVSLHGAWGEGALTNPPGPLVWFTALSAGSNLTIPWTVLNHLPTGSTLSWLEFSHGEIASQNPKVYRMSVSGPGRGLTVQCHVAGCALGDLILLPPLPIANSVTRVGEAYGSSLVGEPGNVRPVPITGDWASVYNAALTSMPSSAGDAATWIRAVAVVSAVTAMLVILVGGITRRALRYRRRPQT